MNIKIQMLMVHILQQIPFYVASNFEQRLREHIFKNYSALIRPVIDRKRVMAVTFNIKLMQVLSVDERDQKVTTQSYYSMKWRNEFLHWDPKDWGGVSAIFVKPNTVWIPDIILKNNGDSNTATVQENTDFVRVHYDGNNSWYPKLMLTSSFHADVKNFPFDKQTFSFHFTSWRLGNDKLLILKDSKPMLDKFFVTSTEWDLVKMEKKLKNTAYDSDSYSEIIFEYVFSRKSSYCVITAILPCIMLMTIVLSSYLLPPNCGERIGVLITAILAFTVFLQVVNASLPRNSDAIPILKLFYLVTMAECTLCFLASCLAIRLLNKKDDNTIPLLPFWMKRYLSQNEDGEGELRPMLERSRVMSLIPPTVCENGYSDLPIMTEITKPKLVAIQENIKPKKKDQEKIQFKKSNTVTAIDLTQFNHHTENKMVGKASRRRESDKKLANELAWKLLVEYLDRICLYFFFILFSLTSGVILLPAYLER